MVMVGEQGLGQGRRRLRWRPVRRRKGAKPEALGGTALGGTRLFTSCVSVFQEYVERGDIAVA